jgi:hypothetical protein
MTLSIALIALILLFRKMTLELGHNVNGDNPSTRHGTASSEDALPSDIHIHL